MRLASLAVLIAACSKTSAPAAPPDAAPIAAVTPDAPPPPAPPPSRAALHVAGKQGIVEIGADGTIGRKLVATEDASSPRYLPGRKGIVYLAGADVHVLSLDTGKDEKIATMPTQAKCHADSEEDITLAVQDRDDVRLDADGTHLCVLLQDRNVNMMSFARSVRVDLKSHKVEDRWTAWDSNCDEKATGEVLDCPQREAPAAPKKDASFPYRYEEHKLIGPEGKNLGGIGDFVLDTAPPSPSGRWVILAGNLEEGDYIHMNLLLLDRQTGEVFPLGGESGKWPKPLKKKELKKPTREALGDRAGDFVGESARYFLDDNTLVMDNALLFLDQKKVVAIPGELAE